MQVDVAEQLLAVPDQRCKHTSSVRCEPTKQWKCTGTDRDHGIYMCMQHVLPLNQLLSLMLEMYRYPTLWSACVLVLLHSYLQPPTNPFLTAEEWLRAWQTIFLTLQLSGHNWVQRLDCSNATGKGEHGEAHHSKWALLQGSHSPGRSESHRRVA